MHKSSFKSFNSRLAARPQHVRNDGGVGGGAWVGGLRKSTALCNPQTKRYTGTPVYSGASGSNTRSVLGGPGGRGNNGQGQSSGIGAGSSSMRASYIGARGRSDFTKDPRPVFDKDYQSHCIRTLIDFLTESKYPHPLTPKTLQLPSSKDVSRIFEYICNQVLDTNIPEEKIPRMLKMMGYPFNISKSSMHSMATPHTWPTLLVALIWMIELHKVVQTERPNDDQMDLITFPPEDEESRIKFVYGATVYAGYMAGMEEFDAFDKELDEVLEDKWLGQSGDIKAISNENVRIAEEIELLDQEKIQADKCHEQGDIMLLDERKLQDFISEMENIVPRHKTLFTQAEDEHALLVQEMRLVQSKNHQMQLLYEKQDLTPAEGYRLKLTSQELQISEKSLEEEGEDIKTDIWKREIGMARTKEQLVSDLLVYSRLARALHLIPSTLPAANGINYELRSSDSEFLDKFKNIKPALVALKTKGKEELQQLDTSKWEGEEQVEHMAEQTTELERVISQLHKGIKDIDEEIRWSKELYQGDIDDLKSSYDQREQGAADVRPDGLPGN